MSKHIVSETFLSIEGEAKYSGTPTVYIRYAQCNMKCAGFNNPNKETTTKGYAPLGFDLIDVKSLDDVPEISVGCDSQYAVNPEFKHIWHELTATELAQQVVDLLPNNEWIYPSSQRVSLSLTGGEPTMKWKIIPELLTHDLFKNMNHVIFETNCSVPLKEKFLEAIGEWLLQDPSRVWTWSNSPKLAVSGEKREKAIKPVVAVDQMRISNALPGHVEQYFKFVCDDSDECFDEVEDVMNEYYEGGVPRNVPIYIMPMCCTETQQIEIMQAVADKCIQKGYIYCHRIHNTVYENAIGK